MLPGNDPDLAHGDLVGHLGKTAPSDDTRGGVSQILIHDFDLSF
jgi:hypothetical protein